MQPIVVLADDLSGAAELAGIAFAQGYSAEVQRRFEPASAAEIIAVDTDSRRLTPAAASQCVRTIASAVVAAHPAWMFKKVDSVLRGNARAEIEALLCVTGHERAVLIPGNPSRGRIVENGLYSIHGRPLDQTEFAGDPEHPRLSAKVVDLLGGAGAVAVHLLPIDSSLPRRGICVPDVVEPEHVQARAAQLDDDSLAAGAADFFAAVLNRRGLGKRGPSGRAMEVRIEHPALLVSGSRSAWPQRKRECEDAGVPALVVPAATGGAVASLRAAGSLVLAIGDEAAGESTPEIQLPRLVNAAAQVIDGIAIRALLAEGGATAGALAQRLGWTRFVVTVSAPAGVGVLQPLDSSGAPTFLIKPGSYAWPAAIWREFCRRN
jgi:uncharacterized protein YgbK (DUF1537 family)